MIDSGNHTKKKVDGSIECSNILFGGKFKWDAPNACFCEQYVKPGARRCAVQGEDCTCSGTVFIGKLNVEGVEPAPFKQIFKVPFGMKKNVSASIACNAKSVTGEDDSPDEAKQCFCDDSEVKDIDEAEAEIAFFKSEQARAEKEAAKVAAEEAAERRVKEAKEHAESLAA